MRNRKCKQDVLSCFFHEDIWSKIDDGWFLC